MEDVKKTAAEFAAKYKTYSDGIVGPIAIGNINVLSKDREYLGPYSNDVEYPEGARVIYNLNCKTEKTPNTNATYSHPLVGKDGKPWKVKFNTADYVAVLIVDGWVQKLMTPMSVMKAHEIDQKIAKKIESGQTVEAPAETQAAPEFPAENKKNTKRELVVQEDNKLF
jgi:hypothetical protein